MKFFNRWLPRLFAVFSVLFFRKKYVSKLEENKIRSDTFTDAISNLVSGKSSSINLSDFSLSTNDLERLAAAFKDAKNVKEVNLNNVGLDQEGLTVLYQPIKNLIENGLELLDLGGNFLTSADLNTFVSMFAVKTSKLRTLNLSNNSFQLDQSIEILKAMDVILSFNLEKFDFGGNTMEYEACRTLTERSYYSNFSALQSISVNDCDIDDKGMEKIANVNAPHLTTVNASGNKITSARDILYKEPPSIVNIDLSFNEISAEGISELALQLADNKTLTTLNLRSNHIEDKGAIALGLALKVNITLQNLDISLNKIGEKGIIELITNILLNQKSALTTLVIANNAKITAETEKFIKDAKEKRKTLEIWYNLV